MVPMEKNTDKYIHSTPAAPSSAHSPRTSNKDKLSYSWLTRNHLFENWMSYYISKDTDSISTTVDFPVPNKRRTKWRNFLTELWLHGNSSDSLTFNCKNSSIFLAMITAPSWSWELGWVWTTESIFSLIIPILFLHKAPKELASGLTFLGKSSLILIIRITAGRLLGWIFTSQIRKLRLIHKKFAQCQHWQFCSQVKGPNSWFPGRTLPFIDRSMPPLAGWQKSQ